jgi:hypothetical protein
MESQVPATVAFIIAADGVGKGVDKGEVLNDTPRRSRWSDFSGLFSDAVKPWVPAGPQSAALISVD